MEYKGYIGSAEFDEDTGVFHGRVQGLRDMITYAGRTVKEFQKAFRDSVDDYLDMCAERGEEPEHPYSGKFVVRLDPDVHRAIAAAAARENKSLNTWARDVLAHAVH